MCSGELPELTVVGVCCTHFSPINENENIRISGRKTKDFNGWSELNFVELKSPHSIGARKTIRFCVTNWPRRRAAACHGCR
jgi:hypothetical protein